MSATPGADTLRLELHEAARLSVDEVFVRLNTSRDGLASSEAARRLAQCGPNALLGHTAGPLDVLIGQLKNPLLLLLAATAIIALVLHDRTDAAIILGIVESTPFQMRRVSDDHS